METQKEVRLRGIEHLPMKFVELVKLILRRPLDEGRIPEYALEEVEWRVDDKPSEVIGMYYPGDDSIRVNLKFMFDKAIEMSQTTNKEMSINTLLWWALMNNLFHELNHAWMWGIDPDEMRASNGSVEMEDLANSWAKEQIIELSMDVDLEPPGIGEMPFFSQCWAGYVHEISGDPEMQFWLNRQNLFMERNIIYADLYGAGETHSWRYFQQLMSGDRDNPRWQKPPLDLDMLKVATHNKITKPAAPKPPAPPVVKTEVPKPPVRATETPTMPVQNMHAGYDQDMEDAMAFAESMADDPDIPGAMMEGMDPVIASNIQEVSRVRSASTSDVTRVMTTVYSRINEHIYQKCEPRPDGWFNNPGASVEHIYIGDIPGVNEVLVDMDYTDGNGRWQRSQPIHGWIAGSVVLKNKPGCASAIPCYKLRYSHNGQIKRRAILPQNPNKDSAGARFVQNGGQQLLITNDDNTLEYKPDIRKWVNKEGKVTKKWIRLIKDGVQIACK